MMKKELRELIDGLIEGCAALGIGRGDILYVASDVTQLLSLANQKTGLLSRNDRNELLHLLTDGFQNMVGNEGTLLFPVYTWDFCGGAPFNYSKSLGKVGAWNNWILQNRIEFCRTRHPLYSFMVWGKYTDKLVSMDNQESFGADSPFAWLHEKEGKMLFFCVPIQRGLTFMHYVEQANCVPYRYHKYFIGKYVDERGTETIRCYSMFVRDLSIQMEENLPDAFFEEARLSNACHYQDMKFTLMPDLAKTFDALKKDLMSNGGQTCYHFSDYQIDWTSGSTHETEVSINGKTV